MRKSKFPSVAKPWPFIDDLPPFPLRLSAVPVSCRCDILDPVIVLDPIVQTVFGDSAIGLSPHRGIRSCSIRRARSRKLCPFPFTIAVSFGGLLPQLGNSPSGI